MAELESDTHPGETPRGYRHDPARLVAHRNRHAAHRAQLDVLFATEQEACRADVQQVTGKADTAPQECDWYREPRPEPFCSSACHVGYGSNYGKNGAEPRLPSRFPDQGDFASPVGAKSPHPLRRKRTIVPCRCHERCEPLCRPIIKSINGGEKAAGLTAQSLHVHRWWPSADAYPPLSPTDGPPAYSRGPTPPAPRVYLRR